MEKRKILIVGGLTIAVGTGVVILAHRNRNKKMIAQINEILDSGSQSTGTAADIAADYALNPNYFKTISGAKIYNTESATKIAKKIYDSIGYVYDNETDVVATIKQIPSKVKMSFVASRFLVLYGESLGTFLINHIDKGDNLSQIYNIIKSMPVN